MATAIAYDLMEARTGTLRSNDIAGGPNCASLLASW